MYAVEAEVTTMNRTLVIVAGVIAVIGLAVNAGVDLDNVYYMTVAALWVLTLMMFLLSSVKDFHGREVVAIFNRNVSMIWWRKYDNLCRRSTSDLWQKINDANLADNIQRPGPNQVKRRITSQSLSPS